MKHILTLGAVLCCASIFAAPEFRNDGLKSDAPEVYFTPLKNAALAKGVLTLPAGALHQVTTLPFPAKGLERYILSFRAQIKGPHVIEENPQYAKLFFFGTWHRGKMGQPLATWEIIFRNKEGKRVRHAANFSQFFNVIMNSRMRNYEEEFNTPPETASIEVVFRNANKEDSLLVENLKFTRIESAPTLNINPDFTPGKDNYSGWNSGSDKARIVENTAAPGKYLMRIENAGIRGDAVYVKPGDAVRLEYKIRKTEDTRSGARMVIFTYKDNTLRDDCPTGQLTRNFGFGSKISEGNYSFVVPEGITILRPYLENVTVEYLRFVRDAGETKTK